MQLPGDEPRRAASLLAERADHWSVTADRLAGTADAVSDLRTPVVTHLTEGEEPKFLFESDDEGVGIGSEDATVAPDRGGVFVFTNLRLYLLLGVGEEDKALSLPYESVVAAEAKPGMRHHRIDVTADGRTYYLRIPTTFDDEDVSRAAEYATYQHTQATPDSGGGEVVQKEPQSVEERLERLGEAHSRGLIDTEEFERRKHELMRQKED